MWEDKQTRVEDHRNYTKNPVRGSVVNTDTGAFAARRTKLRVERATGARLETLENEMAEIKEMLIQLLGK